ncbi:MAG: DUF2971 domain-containing protein [Eubacteriales bacterium]|nr:DUF2971 domain-containing protein [Eubacteriales bacterium]
MFFTYKELQGVNENLIIWKYMSLSKFIQIILTSTLWFNRLDNFEDVFEGVYPQGNRRKIYYNNAEKSEKEINEIQKITRKKVYVSCFHINEYESAAMWKLYSSDEGVAIKLNMKSLKASFDAEEKRIYIERVRYVDFSRDFIPDNNIVHLALSKRKSFEHEKELRCIFYDYKAKYSQQTGVSIKVDINELIKEVYISPYAPSYLKNQVEKISEIFGLKANVIRSPLYDLE